jgi:hypothetical protein
MVVVVVAGTSAVVVTDVEVDEVTAVWSVPVSAAPVADDCVAVSVVVVAVDRGGSVVDVAGGSPARIDGDSAASGACACTNTGECRA